MSTVISIPDCLRCKLPGHVARHCLQINPTPLIVCRRCNRLGHLAINCRTKVQVGAGPSMDGDCQRCGQPGHAAPWCSAERPVPQTRRCQRCHREGHIDIFCRSLIHGQPVVCRSCHEEGHTYHVCPHTATPMAAPQPLVSQPKMASQPKMMASQSKMLRVPPLRRAQRLIEAHISKGDKPPSTPPKIGVTHQEWKRMCSLLAARHA